MNGLEVTPPISAAKLVLNEPDLAMKVPHTVKKRRYTYIGPPEFSVVQIGDLRFDVHNFSDEELDIFYNHHPKMTEYFIKNA